MLSPLLLPLLLLPLATLTLADPGLDVNPDLLPSYSSFTHLGYTFSLTSSSFSASLPGSPAPPSRQQAPPAKKKETGNSLLARAAPAGR